MFNVGFNILNKYGKYFKILEFKFQVSQKVWFIQMKSSLIPKPI